MSQLQHNFTRLACLLLLTAAPGCGYRHGELFDPAYRTLAAPIFANRTFYRGVEFQLTEAMAKEIEHRTPYKVVRTAGAQTAITGTIVNVDKKPLNRAGKIRVPGEPKDIKSGLPQEIQVVVTASFEWKDLRTGKIIRKMSRVEGTGEYILTRPVGEPVEVALNEAINELAREIVSSMRADW